MRTNHIGIEVKDLYKIEKFYRKTFGFNLVYRYTSKNTHGLKTVMLEKDSTTIELLQRDREAGFLDSKLINYPHISFFADNVLAEYERIKSVSGNEIKGLTPPRTTGDGFLEFVFSDPEGNMIEVGKRTEDFKDYRIEAVILDLDGTLIDSEENYYLSDKLLLKEYGIDYTPENKQRFVGIGTYDMLAEINQEYGLNESVESLVQKKNNYYLKLARKNTSVFSEMKAFIDLLKDNGFPMAIASGSSKAILDELVPIVHLDEYCNVIVSSDDVRNGKPAPEIFLEAAKRLAVPPENCLVIEDSKYGVEAAKRAFMYCMAIPYLTVPLDDNFIMADYLCENGMKDFNAKRAFDWIGAINGLRGNDTVKQGH